MKCKSLFLSDLHLGTNYCQARRLLQFLKKFETPDQKSYNITNLFLVGDIIDFEHLSRKNEWTHEHWQVIQKFLRMSRKGVNIYYIQGNHDSYIGWLRNQDYGNISFRDKIIYKAVNGKRYAIFHGHQFDTAIHSMPWLYWLGDTAYSVALFVNKIFDGIRNLLGYKSNWSLSYWLKTKVKSVVQMASDFEKLVVKSCVDSNCDGCILGHIHFPDNKIIENKHYLNCGAWVEICTAIIETEDGQFNLISA
jgi:UDP-2,3-diacylglucosamine pyrophosphatase LpxH